MLRKIALSIVAAFALTLLGGALETADAKRGGKHYHRGHVHKFHGAHVHRFHGHAHVHRFNRHHHVHRHVRRHLYVGVPLAAYGYYTYADSCYALRQRAVVTGSEYWWDRYYACLDGYYYD